MRRMDSASMTDMETSERPGLIGPLGLRDCEADETHRNFPKTLHAREDGEADSPSSPISEHQLYWFRQDQIGSIAAGKNADLVVMKCDPAIRIADIENVDMVFKHGAGYDANKLLDSVKGRGCLPLPHPASRCAVVLRCQQNW
jgi:hypothetical protein